MSRLKFYSNLSFIASGLRFGWLYIFFICFSILFTGGCKKDIINSDSGFSKEFSVELPKEVTTIIRGIGSQDSIKAQIRFPGQSGNQFDISAYTYTWTGLQNQDTLSTKHYLTLNDFEKQDPTLIPYLLTVKEKSTGITKIATSSVFITTPTREGWILLGDHSGNASISMLTYTPQGYRKFIDLESELGIDFPLKGKPVSIEVLGPDLIGRKYQWLGITTDQEVKFLQCNDFVANDVISTYLNETLQPSPGHHVNLAVNGLVSFVATKDNSVFNFNIVYMTYLGMLGHYKLNTYSPGQPGASAFKASSIHTFIGPAFDLEYSRLMYDENNYQFVKGHSEDPNKNGIFPLQLPFSFQGFRLEAMSTRREFDTGEGEEEVTAFLFNPINNEGYVIQFLSNGIVKLVKKLSATDANDIVKSKFIEIDYNTGYLIYTKGNEIKAYDYKLGQVLSLMNFGSEEITLIKMTKYTPPFSMIEGRIPLYKELFKRLLVCTYNPSKPNNSGTFRLFQIPLGHQVLVKETEETGFPKIVDATFAPIP